MVDVKREASEPHQRRLVLFIGPPKTASTSLQAFLGKHIGGSSRARKNVFKDWKYPMFFKQNDGLKRIIVGRRPMDMKRIKKVFRKEEKRNVVVASEYLIHYSRLLKGKLFETLSEWTNVSLPEIVIQSRSPRTVHLISLWKQETQPISHQHEPWYEFSFQQYVCSNVTDKLMTERLRHIINPLGVAHDMVYKYQLPTYFMDMAGIARKEHDVSHAFACSVMRVQCTEDNKWVRGLEGVTMQRNAREGDPVLSNEQMNQMENVFRQRDCAYKNELYNHSLFHLLYSDDESWPQHCNGVSTMAIYQQNASTMLREVRRIMQCQGHGSSDSRVIQPKDLKDYVVSASSLPVEVAAFLVLVLILAIHRMRRRQPKMKS